MNPIHQEHVVLVDTNDHQIGTMEKMEAHRQGVLHRAFSVFLFNDQNELLLQKRALSKYHSGGLWTNTCCSHPRPGESVQDAALRRLKEEMGIQCDIDPAFSFIYKAKFENELTEHEFDHVFIGSYNQQPSINPEEVSDYKWISLHELKSDLEEFPNRYTAWFRICFDELLDYYDKKIKNKRAS